MSDFISLAPPEFYGDLVCINERKLLALIIFSVQFTKIISHYKKIDYIFNVLHQTACLVVKWLATLLSSLTLKAPITTAADHKFFTIFPNF